MIMIRKGNEVTFYSDDGATVVLRCELPEDFTMDDLAKVRDHLAAELKRREAGPS